MIAALAFLRPALSVLVTVLTFGITLPVWIILAILIWVHFDKTSSIRHAVDRAVTELVAGAELEAANAKVDGLQQINSELRGRADALSSANIKFSTSLQEAQNQLEGANDRIADLLKKPVNSSCTVDDDIFNGLRSK